MRYPLLIHVGLHKTASTFLQKCVFDADKKTFLVPWPNSSKAVTEFVAVDPLAFDADASRTAFEQSLYTHKDYDKRVAVISHEALSSRPHENLYYAPYVAERLHTSFPDAKILLVIREQKRLIYSLYLQSLIAGNRLTLQEFIGTGRERDGWTAPIHLSFYEYDRLITLYQKIFGTKSVLVLPYEMLAQRQEDFLSAIYNHIGRRTDHIPQSKPINPALGAVSSLIMRRANYLSRPHALGPNGTAYPYVRKAVRRLNPLIPQAWDKAVERRFRRRIEDRIGNYYAASNHRTGELLGMDLSDYGY